MKSFKINLTNAKFGKKMFGFIEKSIILLVQSINDKEYISFRIKMNFVQKD